MISGNKFNSTITSINYPGMDKVNEEREPSQRLPNGLLDQKRIKGMGMFAELVDDEKKDTKKILKQPLDYSEHGCWNTLMKIFPFLRPLL